jgi:hypothetical protein
MRPEAVLAGTTCCWSPCNCEAYLALSVRHWAEALASLLNAPSWTPKPPLLALAPDCWGADAA